MEEGTGGTETAVLTGHTTGPADVLVGHMARVS